MRNLLLLIVTAILFGCKQNNGDIELLSHADSIMEQHPDSALLLLQSIGDTIDFREAQRAYYLLLLTQAEYKCDTIQTVDTLLDYSINHYRKTSNESLLARSLYYRGMTQFYRGKPDIAITYLCEGVDIAKHLNDMLQLSKYYESLFQVNFEAKYYEKSLDYAKLFLDNSIERKDTDCVVRGYGHLSISYDRLKINDSILFYLQKSFPLLHNVDKTTQAVTLTNIGVRFYELQKYDSAKIYLNKSLAINYRYNTCKVLGDIYYKEGKTDLATEYWNKALATPKTRLKISILKSIHEYVLKSGDYELAHILLNNITHLEDSFEYSKKTKEIAQLQYEYEASKKEKKYFKEKSNLYMLMLILLFVIFSISILLYVYRCKIRLYIDELKLYANKEKNYDRLISDKERMIKMRESEIRKLEQGILKLKKDKDKSFCKHDEDLRIGNDIYSLISDGERIPVDIARAELCLIEYFKTIYPEKSALWNEQYGNPAKRQFVYLILKDMKYDDNKIQYILCCSDTALRIIRSRLNKGTKEK